LKPWHAKSHGRTKGAGERAPAGSVVHQRGINVASNPEAKKIGTATKQVFMIEVAFG